MPNETYNLPPGESPEEILSSIETKNVESHNPNRFHGFYSPDWSENHE